MPGSSAKSAETPSLIPREAAEKLLDQALAGRRLPSESVPVRGAAGRTLAAPALSRLDLPPFDKSAVDGYALPEGDPSETFSVRETVAAGQAPPAPLGKKGEAVRIMTGAPVPPGTCEVVMLEDTAVEGARVRVLRRGRDNIALRGEDVRAGAEILPAGRVLGVLDVANLVSCGLTHVEVSRKPRLAVLSTGDELADDPADLRPGRIMDSNGPLLAGLAALHGLELVSQERVPDEAGPLRAALSRALERADLVVLSGGVSVGEFDLVPEAFASLGLRLLFRRLLLKPGRPTTVAIAPGASYAPGAAAQTSGIRRSGPSRTYEPRKFGTGSGTVPAGGQLVFGLPGNPLAVYLAFHLFVRRAAACLAGASPPLRELSFPLAARFKRKLADREEFVPARLTPEGRIATLECHGSAHLLALTSSDGFLVVPAGTKELEAGAPARFVPVPSPA